MEHAPTRLVMDCSLTLAWLFHDENDPYADAIALQLSVLELFVPRLWYLEIANVLLMSERKGRSSASDTATWFSFLAALPVAVDRETEFRAWGDTYSVAKQHQITIYDASYLELAIRSKLPIATLDKKLRTASLAAGVPLFQPDTGPTDP